jgi:hypothetical protein
MKSLVTVILLSMIVFGCDREKLCSEAEQKTNGQVLKVSGPDSLQLGKTVPLLVEVAVNDTFCVKKAEGVIIQTMGNHVQVGARLVHTGYRKDGDCACTNDETIHTVIYFTPNVPGSYTFSSEPPSPINRHGDTSDYEIIVH